MEKSFREHEKAIIKSKFMDYEKEQLADILAEYSLLFLPALAEVGEQCVQPVTSKIIDELNKQRVLLNTKEDG